MITEEEYKKWKPLIEEYEEAEFQHAQLQSMYCTKCQALEEHDCFCEEETDTLCSFCCSFDNKHAVGCPFNTDPYDQLLNEGYD